MGCSHKADTQQGALKRALRRSFRFAGSVSMQWLLFGSGGHKTRPEHGQLAGFDRCNGVLSKQMKCLGNSHFLHQDAAFRPFQVRPCSHKAGV